MAPLRIMANRNCSTPMQMVAVLTLSGACCITRGARFRMRNTLETPAAQSSDIQMAVVEGTRQTKDATMKMARE